MTRYGSINDSCIFHSEYDGFSRKFSEKRKRVSDRRKICVHEKSINERFSESRKYTNSVSDYDQNKSLIASPIIPSNLKINLRIEDLTVEKENQPKYRKSPLASIKILTIFILCVANFCNSVGFTFIAPFYPGEAKLKGLNQTEIGIIFGIFELVIFISAPVFGKYMTTVGSKRMFIIGLIIAAVTSFFFGFLNLLPSGAIFFWASLIARIVKALGDSAFLTSSFVIVTYSFPDRISTIVSILEMFCGFGHAVGPAVGGVLYQYGGFSLPFLVLATLLILAAGLSYYLVEKYDSLQNSTIGIFSLLRIPSIILIVSANISCAISFCFINPTLAGHLESFSLSPMLIGLMFLFVGGMYALTAPFWGYLIDHRKCARSLMLFGSIFLVFSMLIIGPTPLLPVDKSLYSISASLIIMGLAVSALYIPSFKSCSGKHIILKAGYKDNLETYGIVSGLFQSTFSLGGFLGPTIGGIFVEYIGFEWTTTINAGIHLIVKIVTYLRNNSRRNYKNDIDSKIEETESFLATHFREFG